MNRTYYVALLLGTCVGLLGSCSKDKYEYPPVKLELITIESGSTGTIQTFVTDDGERLTVAEDKSQTVIDPDSRMRVLSNYQLLSSHNGTLTGEGVIYAVGSVVSADPIPVSEIEGDLKTDPVTLQSIWMGEDFLNLVVLVKAQSGVHYFRFIEDEIVTEDEKGITRVYLSLYHDASNDTEAYTKKAYLSIPLRQYASVADGREIQICFQLNTYDGEESRWFEYIPSDLY
ncbi:MAG: NigD-like protein [Bacteroides sp.]|nr:NigD-like protein [Bacteroides sp.]